MSILLVALGGALGAPARLVVDRVVASRVGRRFPWSTLTVNLTGSLALGLVVSRAPSPEVHALVATGFLGAYTTFSTYVHEVLALARTRAPIAALAVSTLTLAGGPLALWIGLHA